MRPEFKDIPHSLLLAEYETLGDDLLRAKAAKLSKTAFALIEGHRTSVRMEIIERMEQK